METIQFIGACIGYTVSGLTLISLIVRPIRIKIINKIKGINQTDSTIESLQRIERDLTIQKDKLDKIAIGSQASLRNSIIQLAEKCLARGYITTIEKLNIIDMYNAYHDLGGDTYVTDRYELVLELPEKN